MNPSFILTVLAGTFDSGSAFACERE
jgi:hypothetical protein